MTARDKALAALAAHRAAEQRAQERIDRERVQLVADARTAGATWEQIGAALGQKASNANRKYKPKLAVEQKVTPKADSGAKE